MVLTENAIFATGPPDVEDEEEYKKNVAIRSLNTVKKRDVQNASLFS
jgi:hypothetical protein